MTGSEIVTHGIRITVMSEYNANQSHPEHNQWLYIYTITINNERSDTVQLLDRHWTITNGNGETEIVKGPGVIGQQPIIKAGQSFQYSSACPLDTELGCMHGHYTFVTNNNEKFTADIAPFSLAQADLVH